MPQEQSSTLLSMDQRRTRRTQYFKPIHAISIRLWPANWRNGSERLCLSISGRCARYRPAFPKRVRPHQPEYPVSTVGDVRFVTNAYAGVFGHNGNAAQIQQFVDQLNYFENLYTAAGIFGSTSNIDLLARGAIYGQMLEIAHGGNLGDSSPVFNLTTGQDSIELAQSGSIVNGTFGGAGATWTIGDFIASADTTNETFNIRGIGAAGILNVTSVQGAHVVGVQNVNITAAGVRRFKATSQPQAPKPSGLA